MVMAKKTEKSKVAPKASKATPAAKATVVKKASSVKKVDDIEAIRKKAEEIYHARVARGEHGNAESDWHQAEKLIKAGKK